MKRTDLLKSIAALPLLGGLLTSPVAVTTEETAGEETEVISVTYGQLTRGGMMLWTNPRPGWPSMFELEDAAAHGFDRYEMWSNIRGVLYQAPTIGGKLPSGWSSLEYAGFIK